MSAPSPTTALPHARGPMSMRRRCRVRTSADAIAVASASTASPRPVVLLVPLVPRRRLVEHVLAMRFTYAESMCDPSYLAPLARAAEEAGYDSFSVPDSLFFPAHSDARYPYNPDGDRAFLEDKPIVEPFTLIPWLAAVTERLRFTTFVVKAPVRPAVLLAKQAASVAVLSGNPLRPGVGISPRARDFAALPRLLARLAELRREAGREDEPFEIHVISMDAFSVDGVRRLEDMGVTDVVVGFRYPYVTGPDTEPLQDKLDALRRFADKVVARVA